MRDYLYRLHFHVGKLGDVSSKHRSAILLLSVLLCFIDPEVRLSFGSASLVGLGISIQPPQDFTIGTIVLVLLIYRVPAFWISVLIENGTNNSRAERIALSKFDPGSLSDQFKPSNIDELVSQEARKNVQKWTVRQITWEVVFPNILALISLAIYSMRYSGLI